jgi:hypothetical protein
MRKFFGHKEHLARVALLAAAAVAVFVALQALLVPESFGLYGHYRAAALDDNRDRALAFAGRGACVECHSDVPEAAKGGAHEAVRCEACHGPLAAHAADPTTAAAQKPDSRVLCVRCHQMNVARPSGFPQVDAAEHAGGDACTSCHAAHNPGLGDEKGATP